LIHYQTKRSNSCLPGELARQGTNINDLWCTDFGVGSDCQLQVCSDCGEGLELCDQVECNSCHKELGCRFDKKIVGGACESDFPSCENCFGWLKNKISKDGKCEPQILAKGEIFSPTTWYLYLVGGKVTQNGFCPFFLVILFFTIVLVIIIVMGLSRKR